MPLVTKLQDGLVRKLQDGLGSIYSSGPTLLGSLDFSAPATQSFPTTAAGLASLLGDATATPSYIWDCQETSGNLVDSIASETLAPTSGPLQGQTAVGLWDGTSYVARNAVEGTSTATTFNAASSSVMDSASSSVAFLVVFRCHDSGAGSQYLLRKRSGTPGYYMRIPNSTTLWFASNDAGANQQLAASTGTPLDGAWHVAVGGYHATNDVTHIVMDGGTYGTDAAPTLGTQTNAGVLTYLDDADATQIAYTAAFEGAAAEALLDLGATAVTNFWTHATDPTGLLTTATRASLISTPVAAGGYVGHFATNTLAIGYNSNFTDTNKLALYCNSAVTNLVTYSELLSNWTSSNMTELDANADAPDGFRNATRLTASANNGYSANVIVTAAVTKYTLSVYIKEVTVGCTGRLIFYDETGAAELASQVFTATADWDNRVTVTATTNAGQVSSSLRIEIDTSGEQVLAWGAQAELGGPNPTAYIRTNGASASLVASVYTAPFTVNSAVGEIDCVFAKTAITSSDVYNAKNSIIANHNRRRLGANTANDIITLYAGTGATEDTTFIAHSATLAETTVRQVWDESAAGGATGGFEHVLVRNGTTKNGGASPWENTTGTGNPADEIHVGHSSGISQPEVFIQSIFSYDGLNGDLP